MKNYTSGTYINEGHYKSFRPSQINRVWTLDDMDLLTLLSEADRQLGRLDMHSEYIPNIDLFISMHVLKEAVKSSKIEGTKTNIEEALLDKLDVKEEKQDDWQEVQNYILALNSAIKALQKLPLSTRVIKQAHNTLLHGVRGKHKLPGEYRTSQNWIGGATINDAIFVPPVHALVNDYMSDLEKFIHNEKIPFPILLKSAIMHYQFETIHPFLDGNGRVGRLMITLYLVEKKILKKPILYLSDFFERNRTHYYDNLMRVREKNDINQWCRFYLVGIIETAKSGIKTFDGIMKLKAEMDDKVKTLVGRRAANALILLKQLYKVPLIDAQKSKAYINLSLPSIYTLLDELVKLNILQEITGGERGKQYLFKKYIDLFR